MAVGVRLYDREDGGTLRRRLNARGSKMAPGDSAKLKIVGDQFVAGDFNPDGTSVHEALAEK